MKNIIDYFPNEKGDYTITRYGEPVAIAKNERDAHNFVKTYKSLTLRIDTLTKCIEADKRKFDELEKEIRLLNNKLQQCTI